MGAGCGDYDLITLRGINLLRSADVVVYDSLIDSRLLDFAPDSAEKICVGKRAGRHSEAQESINEILVKKALEGKPVVRLKGGDPFVFGRGGEEIIVLKKNNIPYSVVPGISSSIAVPELCGIPVTHRKISRSFHVITGHTAEDILPENMRAYAQCEGTLVFLMGLKNLGAIAEKLIEYGRDKNNPAAVISNGASAKSRVVRSTLENIADEVSKSGITAPAVIIVGETVDFDFSSTISLPLDKTSVTITGTKRFSNRLDCALSELGADVYKLGYLNVEEYENDIKLETALSHLDEYSLIVLTSINGAEIFFRKLRALRIDLRRLAHLSFAVIGSGTASVLESHGIFADIIPEEYTSATLGRLIVKKSKGSERVLILRAEKGSPELTQILSENNIIFDDIKTYDVKCSKPEQKPDKVDTDFITFASSSGVEAFFENGYSISDRTKIIAIGSITAAALKKHGIGNCIISSQSSIEGIAEVILQEVGNEQIQKTEKQ